MAGSRLVRLGLCVLAATVVGGCESPLVEEDFKDAEGIPFALDNDRFIQMGVEDGYLSVEIDDPNSPHLIRSIFDRSFPALTFEATIQSTFQSGEPVLTSVGCWNADSGYLLVLLPDGEAGLIETVSELTGERIPLSEDTIKVDGVGTGVPIRMGITCTGGGIDPTMVSAWVDDSPSLSVSVDQGLDSFNAVGFFLRAEGSVFRIDDVLVTE